MRSRTPCFRNRGSHILIILMLQECCPGYWNSTPESDHSGSDVATVGLQAKLNRIF